MTPEERKARNRLWHLTMGMVGRWERTDGQTALQCARELRALLSVDQPRPPGRPKSKGWV